MFDKRIAFKNVKNERKSTKKRTKRLQKLILFLAEKKFFSRA